MPVENHRKKEKEGGRQMEKDKIKSWADELTEEEEKVLQKTHKIDKWIKENKSFKVGLLDGVSE
jgi:hypothetical protein